MLTFSVLMTFMTPFTSLKNVFAADSEPFIYAPEAFSKQQLINDGWVSTVTDSSGKITKIPPPFMTRAEETIFGGNSATEPSRVRVTRTARIISVRLISRLPIPEGS